jgi:hypothetical protein
MNPQSELAKRLSIAIQALQSATVRNDGPCQHIAANEVNACMVEVDKLVEENAKLKTTTAE